MLKSLKEALKTCSILALLILTGTIAFYVIGFVCFGFLGAAVWFLHGIQFAKALLVIYGLAAFPIILVFVTVTIVLEYISESLKCMCKQHHREMHF